MHEPLKTDRVVNTQGSAQDLCEIGKIGGGKVSNQHVKDNTGSV